MSTDPFTTILTECPQWHDHPLLGRLREELAKRAKAQRQAHAAQLDALRTELAEERAKVKRLESELETLQEFHEGLSDQWAEWGADISAAWDALRDSDPRTEPGEPACARVTTVSLADAIRERFDDEREAETARVTQQDLGRPALPSEALDYVTVPPTGKNPRVFEPVYADPHSHVLDPDDMVTITPNELRSNLQHLGLLQTCGQDDETAGETAESDT